MNFTDLNSYIDLCLHDATGTLIISFGFWDTMPTGSGIGRIDITKLIELRRLNPDFQLLLGFDVVVGFYHFSQAYPTEYPTKEQRTLS